MKNKIEFPRKLTLGNFHVQRGQTFNVLGHNITVESLDVDEDGGVPVICYANEGENKTAPFVWKYFKNGIMLEADIEQILC